MESCGKDSIIGVLVEGEELHHGFEDDDVISRIYLAIIAFQD